MAKINKNVASVGVFSILISSAIVLAMQRYATDILQSTVTSCQALVEVFAIKLPHLLLILPVLFVFFIFASAIARFLFYFLKIIFLQKKRIPLIRGGKQFVKTIDNLELGNTIILIGDSKPFAFCFGVFKPQIYISKATLSLARPDELRAILYHEKFHLQKKDTLVILFISTVESLFPFFPVFSDILRHYQIEQEIKADRSAIENVGHLQPVLSILRKLLTKSKFDFAYISQVASRDTLEPRINALINGNSNFRKFKAINIVISFMSLAFLAVAIYSPVQAVDLHEKQQDYLVVCLSGQSCTKTCSGQEVQQSYSKPLFYPIQNASYSLPGIQH